jgi:glycine/D-amino acid oxidase-like deaminating enzyme
VKKIFDYLIVGQGIAGTIMAWVLKEKGHTFRIVNDPGKISASSVSAGVYNPVTGKRKNVTWNGDILFPFLKDFYRKVEKELGIRLIVEFPIYHRLNSNAEINDWQGKLGSPIYGGMVEIDSEISKEKDLNFPQGALKISGGGYIKVEDFLKGFRDRFPCYFLDQEFKTQDLFIMESDLEWGGDYYKKIVFCEGFYAVRNPYFSWLPFNPVKGEILKVKSDLIQDKILNAGVYMVPLENNLSSVGATYNWEDLTWETTEKAKQELIEKLDLMVKFPYKTVVDHKAGIRPATDDRKPFLGSHPEYKHLFIFNGLGTKGVSIAPFYAYRLYDFMEKELELEAEVDIKRHFSLFYKASN